MFASLAALPAQVDPSVLADLSPAGRALVSFVVVLVVAAGLLNWRAETVERAVERTADASPLAVAYGLVAFGLVAAITAYGLSQVARAGLDGRVVEVGVVVVVGGALSALGAFGYLVVGSLLTEFEGPRRPWIGAVVGAVLSAIPLLALPTLPALAVWTLVAAVGVGSPTRHYIHSERTVESERETH